MRRLIFGMFLAAFSGSAMGVIFSQEHPAIQANELARATGSSGVCAATNTVLVCTFNRDWKAIRLTRGRSHTGPEGTWEPVHEPDKGIAPSGVPESTWVRICIENWCEIWPRSAFIYNFEP